MSRLARLSTVAALIAIAVGIPATSAAQTQPLTHVRVLASSARIMRWLGPQNDVILVVDQGTTLEVLDFDRQEDSYWVILPPDLHGTRKVGWIRATSVERYAAAPRLPWHRRFLTRHHRSLQARFNETTHECQRRWPRQPARPPRLKTT